MKPVTITASIFSTDRVSTFVSVEFADASASRGSWSALVLFKKAGHKARAEQYIALVGREHASAVAAVRALASAEMETMPADGVSLQFVDSLLGLAA